MPRKGNQRQRLKSRGGGGDSCGDAVTVADFANTDPAVVKSGRVKKAMVNAIHKEAKLLCGLEASMVPVTGVGAQLGDAGLCDSDDTDCADFGEELSQSQHHANAKSRKKRSKPASKAEDHGDEGGQEFPMDLWLLLAAYIRPEDVGRFALISKRAWFVTCTTVFWARLYRRYYHRGAELPARLQLEEVARCQRGLKANVVRSLCHLYEPFRSRVQDLPPLPDSTPDTLQQATCLMSWHKRVNCSTHSQEQHKWEFNFKFRKQAGTGPTPRGVARPALAVPREYQGVSENADGDCCLLQVTVLNFILVPVVMGMTLSQLMISVSTDMRHHRVKLAFVDSPAPRGRTRRRMDAGPLVVLDPVCSVRILPWWHPLYPY
ncbi:transmembrane protein 183A isoform X1 [Lampetra planeri]